MESASKKSKDFQEWRKHLTDEETRRNANKHEMRNDNENNNMNYEHYDRMR